MNKQLKQEGHLALVFDDEVDVSVDQLEGQALPIVKWQIIPF